MTKYHTTTAQIIKQTINKQIGSRAARRRAFERRVDELDEYRARHGAPVDGGRRSTTALAARLGCARFEHRREVYINLLKYIFFSTNRMQRSLALSSDVEERGRAHRDVRRYSEPDWRCHACDAWNEPRFTRLRRLLRLKLSPVVLFCCCCFSNSFSFVYMSMYSCARCHRAARRANIAHSRSPRTVLNFVVVVTFLTMSARKKC